MKLDKEKTNKALKKIRELLFSGVVIAVVASLFTQAILEYNAEKRTQTDRLDSISNIYIGSSKQWADEQFGAPNFTGQKDEYTLCAYLSEYYLIQIAFDQSESLQAYMVTLLENDDNITIPLEYMSELFDTSLVLGDFTYYDFPTSPMNTYGYVGNGAARMFYGEEYYFMSAGNYANYYIATYDFGKIDGSVSDLIASTKIIPSDITIVLDDEVSSEIIQGMSTITDRKTSIPNTFGVSVIGKDIRDILFTYDWFNSLQIRDRLPQ